MTIIFIVIGVLGHLIWVGIQNEVNVEDNNKKFSGIDATLDLTASSTLIAALSEFDGTSEVKPAILGTSTTAVMADPIDFEVDSSGIDQFCMNIYWTGSTTDAVLNAEFYASQDKINWYAIDTNNSNATTSALSLDAATSTLTIFNTGSTDTRTKHWCPRELSDLNTEYLKVRFKRSSNLSGGKLFVEGIKISK